jgi:hypothetical protein
MPRQAISATVDVDQPVPDLLVGGAVMRRTSAYILPPLQ